MNSEPFQKENDLNPLLKWAGGKRWLLPHLKSIWQAHEHCKLVEPFVGGMSVALGLNPDSAWLNDANIHLINFYNQVKKGLIVKEKFKNNEKYYKKIRERFNYLIETRRYNTKEAASLFYYLIRTGYNGLCRFNSSGYFNVPFGSHKSIRYKMNFLDYQSRLSHWHFSRGDFEKINLKGDEFIYADPPYDVEFTRYHKKGFDFEDQIRLAEWLSKHPGPVVASNQATQRILELYQDHQFTIYTLLARRSISCNGDRTPALEMLAVKNMQCDKIKAVCIS